MTAQFGSRIGGGVRSLEVRWIFAGQLAAGVAGWFGRFTAETTELEDTYLLDPHLPGLSLKVRERRALEVKMYEGSLGLLEVAGRARGRVESWHKWSFPRSRPSQGSGYPAGWRPVRKIRRITWFSLAGGPSRAGVPGPGEEQGCAVELTEIRAGGEAWWTLGFEATGPVSLQRGGLEAAAALVFAQALPGEVELGLDDAMSYEQWLRRERGADSDAGAVTYS
jgi:hypothetical protein